MQGTYQLKFISSDVETSGPMVAVIVLNSTFINNEDTLFVLQDAQMFFKNCEFYHTFDYTHNYVPYLPEDMMASFYDGEDFMDYLLSRVDLEDHN